MTVAILTVSDSAVAGTRADLSGPSLKARCSELGWSVVAADVLPDEQEAISKCLSRWADEGIAELILTTGGTGIAPRDITPEATRAVLDREIPGFGELMRVQGLQQTPLSPLSRALAGSRGAALIVNLPGSPKGAVFSLNAVSNLIPHCVRLLSGDTAHGD